jgi:hypothetical protein
MRAVQATRCSSVICLAAAIISLATAAFGQPGFELRPAEPIRLPLIVDSNSPTFWRDGTLHLYTSSGDPLLSRFDAEFRHLETTPVIVDRKDHFPMWIESVWRADEETIYAWYHHERIGLCPNSRLTAPEIGALVSLDGGRSFRDLGIVLSSGEVNDCTAKNGYFANGHGDFSVILDRSREYFYFLYGAYGGSPSSQGVAIARMPAGNIANPVGAVWKYFDGAWSEPGNGGRVSPIFPATVGWAQVNTDSFWGPSVHWNTYLQRYVVLMNRSCCDTDWPQEGVYLTMNADLGDPAGWTLPRRIVSGGDWYPWAFGMAPGETSSEAGQRVRLFVRETSEWEIVFQLQSPAGPDPVPQPEDPASEDTPSPEPPAEPEPPGDPMPPPEDPAPAEIP